MRKVLVVFFLGAAVSWGAFAEGIVADYPIESGNMNVRTLYEKHNRMVEEINLSVTRGSIATIPNDAVRWLSYIEDFRSYTAYVQSKAFLDWSVTHGRNYVLAAPLETTCEWTDNVSICDLLDMVKNARDEIALSTSSKKMPMHFAPTDTSKWLGYWDGMSGFITDYLLAAGQALDEPIHAAEELLGLEPGWSADDSE